MRICPIEGTLLYAVLSDLGGQLRFPSRLPVGLALLFFVRSVVSSPAVLYRKYRRNRTRNPSLLCASSIYSVKQRTSRGWEEYRHRFFRYFRYIHPDI